MTHVWHLVFPQPRYQGLSHYEFMMTIHSLGRRLGTSPGHLNGVSLTARSHAPWSWNTSPYVALDSHEDVMLAALRGFGVTLQLRDGRLCTWCHPSNHATRLSRRCNAAGLHMEISVSFPEKEWPLCHNRGLLSFYCRLVGESFSGSIGNQCCDVAVRIGQYYLPSRYCLYPILTLKTVLSRQCCQWLTIMPTAESSPRNWVHICECTIAPLWKISRGRHPGQSGQVREESERRPSCPIWVRTPGPGGQDVYLFNLSWMVQLVPFNGPFAESRAIFIFLSKSTSVSLHTVPLTYLLSCYAIAMKGQVVWCMTASFAIHDSCINHKNANNSWIGVNYWQCERW